jgi:hypothetical protein
MLYLAKIYLKNLWVRLFLGLALILNAFHFWYLFTKLRFGENNYFIHYNVIFGVDLVGSWVKLLVLPITGFLVILINFALALYFFNKDKFLSYILALTVLIFEIFLSISLVLIMRLNL